MDAIKAAFESQFGTEWSVPVNATEPEDVEKLEESETEVGLEEDVREPDTGIDDGPVVIKHGEVDTQQPIMTKAQRRKFMNSGAPSHDAIQSAKPTKEDNEDLKNDLALQRLIEESHILHDHSQKFTGADISGAADPLETIGKTRLKVMETRLAKAGAKQKGSRIPQAMAVGIRKKATERRKNYKEEARNAGIVLAKDRHTKNKNTHRDKGLKINSVGKASEYGIHVSPAEIARLTGKNTKNKFRKRK